MEDGPVAEERASTKSRWRHSHPAPFYARRSERDFVGNSRFIPDLEQVRDCRGGRRKLDEASNFRAKRAVPRREVERRVQPPDDSKDEHEQMIYDPVPNVETAVQRVGSGADSANEQPLQGDHLKREAEDEAG